MRLSQGMPQALCLAATVPWVCAVVAVVIGMIAVNVYGGNVSPDVWDGVARKEKSGIVFRADGEDYLLAFRDTKTAEKHASPDYVAMLQKRQEEFCAAVRKAPTRCRVTGTARRSESVGLTIRVDKIEVLK